MPASKEELKAMRLGDVERAYEQVKAGADFIHLAALKLRSKGPGHSAREIAETEPHTPERVRRILKAAVTAGSTGDADFAGNLIDYRVAVAGFVESLRSIGVFDRLLSDMLRIPLRTRFAAMTIVASGSLVAEGAPKPITTLALETPTLEPTKASAIIVVTDEMARAATEAGMAFFGRELRRAVAFSTDDTFLTTLAASVTPIASAGSDADAIREDLRAMILSANLKADSKPYWVFSVPLASALSLMQSAVSSETKTFGPLV
jgi:hypothetical protein